MARKTLFLLILLLFSAAPGCTTTTHAGSHSVRTGTACQQDLDAKLELLDLKTLFAELARELCDKKFEKNSGSCTDDTRCKSENTVLVTDFVDLKSLVPQEAGILMGELMRSSLNSVCGYGIKQAELSKYFTLNEEGLVVLTRNNAEIRSDEVREKSFVAGTFSTSPDKLILFAKMFNLSTGKISRISSKEIDFTCSDSRIRYEIR